jgi:hypothetical protein
MSARESPSQDLRERVLRDVAGRAGVPRSRARQRVAAALGVASVVLFSLSRGNHIDARPLALAGASTAAAAALSLALLGGVVSRWPGDAPSMLPPGARRSYVTVAASFAVLVLVAAMAAAAAGALGLGHERLGCSDHLRCGGLALVQGALPLLALTFLRAGDEPRRPAVTGAALGAVAGAWAGTLAWLRCPHVTLDHGILAHALPALILAAVGAIVGARVLRLR